MIALPRRYGRLIALGILSLLLHLAIIGSIGRQVQTPALPETPPKPLALRLQAAPPPPQRPPVTMGPAPAAPPRRPQSSVMADAPAAADALAAPAAQAAPTLARASVAPDATLDGTDDEAQAQPPGRYRFATPRSTTLDYTLTHNGGAPAPVQIVWQTDGNRYSLAVDGVTGPLASVGAIGDVGVGPAQASMRGPGGPVNATFASNAIVIDGQRHENSLGSQDPASMLMQLTGMGLARPAQLSGTVAIYVATPDGPVIMQFRVIEDEELATPLGNFSTRHLVQRVAAGQPRLEVWLAPERDWLPVQLRLTASDGTSSTQAITRIGATAP
jgi:hypothetical protein